MRTILIALCAALIAQSAFAMGAAPPPVPPDASQLSLMAGGLMTPGTTLPGMTSQTAGTQPLDASLVTPRISPCGRR